MFSLYFLLYFQQKLLFSIYSILITPHIQTIAPHFKNRHVGSNHINIFSSAAKIRLSNLSPNLSAYRC